jgi:hypothetical protein
MVTHAIRAAWLSRNDPPNAPMAVRQAAAITTSFIVFSLPAKWDHTVIKRNGYGDILSYENRSAFVKELQKRAGYGMGMNYLLTNIFILHYLTSMGS